MDVDYLSCSPDAQMELMAMMVEMDKFNQLSQPTPPLDLPGARAWPPLHSTSHSPLHCLPGTSAALPVELSCGGDPADGQRQASVAAMREMIFRVAAMQPVHIDPESVKPPKRRNVRVSKDPQSVAARHRRERISERIRILQRLVPGGTKMDTASMLDEAIHYVKFLKNQVQSLERAAAAGRSIGAGVQNGMGFFSGGSSYNLCQGQGFSYQPMLT